MLLALLPKSLQMPRQIPQCLVAAASGATPQAANRTPHALRPPTTALLVVGLVAGGATLPPHPVVVLASPRLLLIMLDLA